MSANGNRSFHNMRFCQICNICRITNKSIKSLYICIKKDDRTILICSHLQVSYSIDHNITFLLFSPWKTRKCSSMKRTAHLPQLCVLKVINNRLNNDQMLAPKEVLKWTSSADPQMSLAADHCTVRSNVWRRMGMYHVQCVMGYVVWEWQTNMGENITLPHLRY